MKTRIKERWKSRSGLQVRKERAYGTVSDRTHKKECKCVRGWNSEKGWRGAHAAKFDPLDTNDVRVVTIRKRSEL